MDKVFSLLSRCIVVSKFFLYIYFISLCRFGDGEQYKNKKTRHPCPMKNLYRLTVKCDGLALNLPGVTTIILIYR